MDVSAKGGVSREVCDLKHLSIEDRFDRQEEVNKALWSAIEEIIQPGTGHIAVAKSEVETSVDKLESRVNGLIMTIITTVVGTAVAIGGEFIKKFVK